jgi:hypothetical protein
MTAPGGVAADRSRSAAAFACPTCHSVVPWLSEVRYAVGMEDRAPSWMCHRCVDELRAQERIYAGGFGGQPIWAVEVIRVRGTSAYETGSGPAAGTCRTKAAGRISAWSVDIATDVRWRNVCVAPHPSACYTEGLASFHSDRTSQ